MPWVELLLYDLGKFVQGIAVTRNELQTDASRLTTVTYRRVNLIFKKHI